MKFVVDYSLYVSNTVAFVIAADLTYDFEMDTIHYTNPESFYVGLQLGMKFGKKVDNRNYAKADIKEKIIKEKKQKVIKSKRQAEDTEVVPPVKTVTPVTPQSQSIVIDIKVNGDKVAPANAVPVVAPVPQATQPIVITVTQPPVQPEPVQQAPVQVAPAQ